MMIGVAPLLLFFGYVEQYALVIVGLAVVALGIVAWDGRRLFWLLFGWAAGLATSVAHPLAAFCLVPLGSATLLHIWHTRQCSVRTITTLGLGLGAAGLVLTGWVLHGRASVLLPFATDAPYGVFGAGHLADAANGLLLMAPMHLVIIGATALGVGLAISSDPVVLCLGLFALAGGLVTWLLNPILGRLDWDLMSMFSIPLGALAAVCAGRHLPDGARGPGLLIITAATFLHLAPWILVNHDPVQAARMVEAMVQGDPHQDAGRRMKLAVKFEDGGFGDEAVRQYITALRSPEANMDEGVVHARLVALRNLGFLLYERGDTDDALQLFSRLRDLLPEDDASRTARSLLQWHAGDQTAAIRLVVAHLLTRPTDRRARGMCRTFSQEAVSGANRDLAALGVTIAAGDIPSATEALARLHPGVLDDPLLLEVQRWLWLRREGSP